jgi:hypothetical protein
MGYLQTPSLRIIDRGDGKNSNIVTVSYDFSTDTFVPITSLPGMPGFHGSSFLIDLTTLGGTRSIPAVRSMQFTAQFLLSQPEPFADGILYFFNPVTGELLQFGVPQSIIVPTGGSSICNAIITAVVPLVCSAPTKLLVVKGTGGANIPASEILTGSVFISLYDFERPPYYSAGFYNGFFHEI